MNITDAPKTIIGRRYQLLEHLGQGGMGAVFRTLDHLTGQSVALKRMTTLTDQLMFSSRNTRTDLRLALANEFQMLASLRHPYIIGVQDYGFDDERQPFFTMELLK